ncbi:MAG: SusC/RagA family TonB-linked outer membrane protein [Bacteroidales bacterium]|nr:SusC/RagA family TonB-linked outer membrane protein [Bacteroidales bacterium]
MAQEITITGTVKTAEDGNPLPGASVLIKGTTTGAVTNIDGYYQITAPAGSVLVFSFVGRISEEITLTGQTEVNIELNEEVIDLSEIVVTALGIKREKKALGYSVSEVSGDDVSLAKEISVINSLSGKVAGVDISSTTAGPSGSARVIIRGNSSLSDNNQPLYVIDGVPIDNSQLGSAGMWGGYDLGDGISSLNPDDIETLSVLKGASAAALYGSRASNGVILITTKSGKNQKGIGVDFSSNYTAEKILSKFDDYQTVYGQGRDGMIPTTEDLLTSQVAWGAQLDPNLMVPIYNGQLKPYGLVNNNILSFFRTGSTFTNTMSFSGGNEKTTVRVSASDMRNKDIVPETGMNRNTFMLNGSLVLSKRLKMDGKVNYITEKVKNRPALSDNPNNVGLAILGIAPNFDQQWLSEGYKDAYGRYVDWNGNIYRINPYWSINEMTNNSKKDRIIGHLQLNYEFTNWLSLQLRGGTDFYGFRFTNYFPAGTPVWDIGQLEERTSNISENNYEGLLKFNKEFGGDFFASAYLGGNIMQSNVEIFSLLANKIVVPDVISITNFTNQNTSYSLYKKQVNSVYGAVQTGYKNMLFVDATFRNDWSSTLQKGNNSYFYPSVSGSFVFSNLLNQTNYFSFGKIRASWAEVGGDTDPYQLSLTYGLKDFSLSGKPLGEITNANIPKLDLKPTRSYYWEVGTDLRGFNNRIQLDVTYYNNLTKNQILPLVVPSSSGYTNAIINAGEIRNNGIEISFTASPVDTKDLKWDITLNYAKNNNKVVKLHEQVKDYTLANARWAGAAIMASEGEEYGVIVGKKVLRDPNGNMIVNAAGMPLFSDSQEILGNGTFDWTAGINNSFRYKNIVVSALFDAKFGADIYSMSDAIAYANGTAKETLEGRKEWYNSEEARLAAGVSAADWSPTGGYIAKGVVNTGTDENPIYVENTTPVNPQDYWNSFFNNSPEPFIYDASFVKLRELTLGYHLPANLLSKTPIRSASVSFVSRNLFILYKNTPNIDPESNYNNGNGQGFEYGSLPSRRSYGFNLNLKF